MAVINAAEGITKNGLNTLVSVGRTAFIIFPIFCRVSAWCQKKDKDRECSHAGQRSAIPLSKKVRNKLLLDTTKCIANRRCGKKKGNCSTARRFSEDSENSWAEGSGLWHSRRKAAAAAVATKPPMTRFSGENPPSGLNPAVMVVPINSDCVDAVCAWN